jgi:Chemotaxis signal transduction protein
MFAETEDHELLTLYAGNLSVGVLIHEINEIIEPVAAAPIPLTCPGFLGLISVRGIIYPLLRLSDLLQAEKHFSLNRKDAKTVICSSIKGCIALETDAVGDTCTFRSEQLSDYGEAVPFFTESVALEQGELPLLDLNRLTEQIIQKNNQVRRNAGLALNH